MFRQRYAPALALMLVTLASYAPTFNGAFLWDDDEYITTNETLKNMSGLPRIWLEPGATSQYYPLVFTTFWVEYHLWGLDPTGYHVVNTLLHGVNAILLWLVLRRLGVPGGWFAAALFAVHPVQVESVAWIQERKNVLSGLFYFAAVLAYLRYARLAGELADDAVADHGRRLGPRGWYALALVFGVCAFFSKTSTCTLPAALGLVLWWKRGRLGARDWLALVPFFMLAVACGLITVWVEKSFVGARGEDFSLSWVERWLVAGRALWFYAGKLVWPWRLAFLYPRWQIDTGAWWQYVPLSSAVAVVILLWAFAKKIGKGPLVAVLFFAGTLAPTLGFVNFYFMRISFVADHFLYLPSVGLLALAAALAVRMLGRLGLAAPALGMAAAPVLVLLLLLTWNQERHFRNQETLWTDTLAKNPDSWVAHGNLGTALLARGDEDHAMHEFMASIQLNPRIAAPHYSLAKLLAARGQPEQAKEHLREVIRLAPQSDHKARAMLGLICVQQRHFDEAAGYLTEEIHLHPDAADAIYNLGMVRVQQRKWAEACACFRRACALQPTAPEYHLALAEALGQTGAFAEAQEHRNKAQRLAQPRR